MTLLVAVTSSATGQSIGTWTLNNTLAGAPGLYNTVSTADFSAGIPTRSFNGGAEYFGENGWPAAALNGSMYLSFTLTPNTGYQLDISSVVLRMRRSNTGSPAGSGPTTWALRSSLDGFTSNIATGSMDHNYSDYTVTPGAAFTNVYTSISFRLYGFNASVGSGGNSRLVVDNIRVNGIGYLLPARVGRLQAVLAQRQVRLSCTIYHPAAGDQYLLERSQDGRVFLPLQQQLETSVTPEKNCVFIDDLSAEKGDAFYYRLQCINAAGAKQYSSVAIVSLPNARTSLQAAIHNGNLQLQGGALAGNYRLMLFGMDGRLLAVSNYTAGSGIRLLGLPTSAMPHTSYVLQWQHSSAGAGSIRLLAN